MNMPITKKGDYIDRGLRTYNYIALLEIFRAVFANSPLGGNIPERKRTSNLWLRSLARPLVAAHQRRFQIIIACHASDSVRCDAMVFSLGVNSA